MLTVAIERVNSYDAAEIETGLARLLQHLGGIGTFVSPGDRVLIKPNLLAAKPPEAAVTTHPALVRAVITAVQDAGGVPLVGDSPGIGGINAVAERTGMRQVLADTGAELVPFQEVRTVTAGGTFQRIELAVPYLAADRIINLPKLKTHEMMTLTCAVKNLFGAVVGAAKPAWHLKAGVDREIFARLLLEIYQVRPPELHIVDAVVAMEGNGPNSGDPRQVGLLLAGTNPLAVDQIAAEIAGIPQRLLYVQQEAARLRLDGSDRSAITTVGLPLADARCDHPFALPHQTDIQFGLPRFLKNHLRRHATARPAAIEDRCIRCGICVAACPPRAMQIADNRLLIDDQLCIRCFCCRELCPHAALTIHEGLLARLIHRFL